MNYLVAIDFWFSDIPGGAARVAWDIARLVRDRGDRVAVLSIRGGSAPREAAAFTEDGIERFLYDKPAVASWRPDVVRRNVAAAAAAAGRLPAGVSWDVVHVHSHFTGAGVMEALGSGPRYVTTLHSPIVLEQRVNWAAQGLLGRAKMLLGLGMLKRLEGDLLRRSHAIHALSRFTRDRVEEFHGLGDRVSVVPYWKRDDYVRTMDRGEARRRLGWPADGFTFFSVRQLRERYGLDVAVEAVAPAARAGRCRFYIGGEGPLQAALEGQAARLGAAERIRLLGRLSDEQLRLAYQAADAFLLPTRALECFGLISIEAMAFGCPVIATDAGAIPEVLRPLRPDLIVPAGDVSALRALLERVLDGRVKLPTGEEVVAYVETHYGARAVAPRVVALLDGGGAR